MADKPDRKSEMGFSNIKVLSKALSADELKALSAGTSDADNENVVLWLDFAADEISSARNALNAQLNIAKDLKNENYTEATWSAFESAKAAAESINGTYATAENVNKAAADLRAAIAGLETVDEPETFDLTLLQAACTKAAELDLSEFGTTGKNAFSSAKASADAALEHPASQKAVDEKAAALSNAMLALRKTPSSQKLPK